MFWKRTPKAPSAPMHFRGIRVGMTEAEAMAQLIAEARKRGEKEVKPQTIDYGFESGGSIYTESDSWHVYLSTDELGDVDGRMGQYRLQPSGFDAGIEWLRARVDELGVPPECHALMPATEGRLHSSQLQWRGGAGLHPMLSLLRRETEDWTVREDWDPYIVDRQPHYVPLDQHRRTLEAVKKRVDARAAELEAESGYREPAFRGAAGLREFAAKTSEWMTAQMRALDALAPILPGVPVVDIWDGVSRAADLIDADVWRLPPSETMIGAFVVADDYETGAQLNVEALFRVSIATGFSCQALTYKPRSAPPKDHPPLTEWVGWLPTPFAQHLLHEPLRGQRCRLIPVFGRDITPVNGAREEIFMFPELSEEEQRRPRKYEPKLTPIRLSKGDSSVYLNYGAPIEDLRGFAHMLLAARLR